MHGLWGSRLVLATDCVPKRKTDEHGTGRELYIKLPCIHLGEGGSGGEGDGGGGGAGGLRQTDTTMCAVRGGQRASTNGSAAAKSSTAQPSATMSAARCTTEQPGRCAHLGGGGDGGGGEGGLHTQQGMGWGLVSVC